MKLMKKVKKAAKGCVNATVRTERDIYRSAFNGLLHQNAKLVKHLNKTENKLALARAELTLKG